MDEVRKYHAFISYRHADNKIEGRQWATWLHQALETYDVPKELVGKVNARGEEIPARIFPIFRDEEELPADADLANTIKNALDSSQLLIVLCSPNAVASSYVAGEIDYFKKLGKSDRIIAAIIKGEPNASWDKNKQSKESFTEEDECFPTPLQFRYNQNGKPTSERAEPVAADFRIITDGKPEEGWTTSEAYRQYLSASNDLSKRDIQSRVEKYAHQQHLMLLKIIAGVLGIPLGELTKRDKEHQLYIARRRQRIIASIALVMLLLTTFSIFSAIEALRSNEQAQQNAATAFQQLAVGALKNSDRAKAASYLNRIPSQLRDESWRYLMSSTGGVVWSQTGTQFPYDLLKLSDGQFVYQGRRISIDSGEVLGLTPTNLIAASPDESRALRWFYSDNQQILYIQLFDWSDKSKTSDISTVSVPYGIGDITEVHPLWYSRYTMLLTTGGSVTTINHRSANLQTVKLPPAVQAISAIPLTAEPGWLVITNQGKILKVIASEPNKVTYIQSDLAHVIAEEADVYDSAMVESAYNVSHQSQFVVRNSTSVWRVNRSGNNWTSEKLNTTGRKLTGIHMSSEGRVLTIYQNGQWQIFDMHSSEASHQGGESAFGLTEPFSYDRPNRIDTGGFSPSGNLFTTIQLQESDHGGYIDSPVVSIYRSNDGKLLKRFIPHMAHIGRLLFVNDESAVISQSLDGTIQKTELNPIYDQPILPRSKGVSSIAFDRVGKYVAANSRTGEIRVWHLASLEVVSEFLSNPHAQICFSEGGERLAIGNTIFDVISGASVYPAKNSEQLVAVSATTPAIGIVWTKNGYSIWQEGGELISLPLNDVEDVSLTRNGKWLFAIRDKEVTAWSTDDLNSPTATILLDKKLDFEEQPCKPYGPQRFYFVGNPDKYSVTDKIMVFWDSSLKTFITKGTFKKYQFFGDLEPVDGLVTMESSSGEIEVFNLKENSEVFSVIKNNSNTNRGRFSHSGRYWHVTGWGLTREHHDIYDLSQKEISLSALESEPARGSFYFTPSDSHLFAVLSKGVFIRSWNEPLTTKEQAPVIFRQQEVLNEQFPEANTLLDAVLTTAKNQDVEGMRVLFELGVQPDFEVNTYNDQSNSVSTKSLLWIALNHTVRRKEMFELFREYGFDQDLEFADAVTNSWKDDISNWLVLDVIDLNTSLNLSKENNRWPSEVIPLHLFLRYPGLIKEEDVVTIKRLLDAGAKATPWVSAAIGDLEALQDIEDLKLKEFDEYGETPLHRAILHLQVDAAEWLLLNGANPELENKSGISARMMSKNLSNIVGNIDDQEKVLLNMMEVLLSN
ncbi:MAG: TIR domain-containing protein [Oceanospirillaceae bacterium]|nr:TIR domain-containing protein [Oceanospirillaceae bacterium]